MGSVLIPRGGAGNTGSRVANILPTIGAAFGPIGGLVGGAAGAVIGGVSGAEADRQEQIASTPQDVTKADIPDATDTDGPMERRSQALDEDPYEQLMIAHRALQNGPKDLRLEYGDQLNEAMRIAQRQRGMA